MKYFIMIGILIALMSCVGCNQEDQSRHPNVVIISCDQNNAMNYGFMRSKNIKTPSLDALANSGFILSQGYLPSTGADKNMMALLTGVSPMQVGGRVDSLTKEGVEGLQNQMLSSILKNKGYATHYDGLNKSKNLSGFDSNKGTVEFISSTTGKPFFIYINSSKNDVDNQIKILIETLKQTKSYDNTMIVYCQNQGIENGHDLTYRTPIIFSYPFKLSKSSKSTSLMSTLDIMPTILDYLDFNIPVGIDGLSYKSVLSGDAKKVRRTISGTQGDVRYMRTMDYYFSWNTADDTKVLFEIINDPACTDNMVSYHPNKIGRFLRELADL